MTKMNIDRAVVEQALEALEYENSWHEIFKVRPHASTVDAITALRTVLAQPVSKMTTHRAIYFMERFKREEKLLGPNEQAALDFVISMLEKQAEPVKPAFYGFMSADGTRVDLCFTPGTPRSDSVYATAYYTTPPKA